MNKIVKSFIIIKLIESIALYPVALGNEAVEIRKGETAKFDGVLLDVEKSQQVKIGLQERDIFKQIVDSQAKSIDLLKQNDSYNDQKVSKLLEQNDKISEQLRSAQGMNTLERIGLFTLGVIATVGAGLIVKKAVQ